MELKTRNVNTAFNELVTVFDKKPPYVGRKPYSNPNGQGFTYHVIEPVTVTYARPTERVLFNPYRDCNPFFHLYEALWMLAGKNDVASVGYYSKQIGQYSDDKHTLNGAYGYRWRCAAGAPQLSLGRDGVARGYTRPGVDQLDVLVRHLKENPDSRRAILQMWNVEDDLLKIGRVKEVPYNPYDDPDVPACSCADWGMTGCLDSCNRQKYINERKGTFVKRNDGAKDVCCNLSVVFQMRREEGCPTCRGNWTKEKAQALDENPEHPCPNCSGNQANVYLPNYSLDMTVFNRSNDLIWGMLGANYVHFTVLQEYMAARLACEVGVYHQVTTDLHVYDYNFKPQEWLQDIRSRDMHSPNVHTCYDSSTYCHFPLVENPDVFDQEVKELVEIHSTIEGLTHRKRRWKEPFLDQIAHRLFCAYHCYKQGYMYNAMGWCLGNDEVWRGVGAVDWREAAEEWLVRRIRRRRDKQAKTE